jgi:hypothetical protein
MKPMRLYPLTLALGITAAFLSPGSALADPGESLSNTRR